ncbi:hypothetical protein LOTGIDRAFT_173738 [Lottia gigantea]|uniref:Uncharacterized protein n=1 Tax=Lottia gigantea TaxID=225164 RepID=V4CBK2_LOTGI|nr:hypothetical protein LOTGIDRAFT_173738 [Lottia gigantea]ESO99249.1 hypothetical protein LOTGIDRAFT_173738 [Lottia gigantea]
MVNKILDPIFRLYDPIRYSFNKKKEDYIIISPTVGSKSQLNDGGRITFEINSLSNWLLLSDAYFRCDFKIKDGTQNQVPQTPNENRVPQTNTTLKNNFFPSLFSQVVLEAGSNPIETIIHLGEFDTMLKTVLYPKDFDSVSDDLDEAEDPMELFTTILQDVSGQAIRKTSATPKRFNKPWFNEDCKTALKERNRALRLIERSPTADNMASFRIARAKARRTIRQAKRSSWQEYVSRINSRTSSKSVWDRIRGIKGKADTISVNHLEIRIRTEENPISRPLILISK